MACWQKHKITKQTTESGVYIYLVLYVESVMACWQKLLYIIELVDSICGDGTDIPISAIQM